MKTKINIGTIDFIDTNKTHCKTRAQLTVLRSLLSIDRRLKIPETLKHICHLSADKEANNTTLVLYYNDNEIQRLNESQEAAELLLLSDFYQFTDQLKTIDLNTIELKTKAYYFYLKCIALEKQNSANPQIHNTRKSKVSKIPTLD